MTSTTDMDKMVAVYIKMRDKKAELKRIYDGSVASIDEQMDLVSKRLMEILDENNQESAKTAHGTVWKTVKSRYTISQNQWPLLYDFVIENKAADLFEKRLCQANVKSWIEDHPDKIPPGLQVDSKYDVTVRRTK